MFNRKINRYFFLGIGCVCCIAFNQAFNLFSFNANFQTNGMMRPFAAMTAFNEVLVKN